MHSIREDQLDSDSPAEVIPVGEARDSSWAEWDASIDFQDSQLLDVESDEGAPESLSGMLVVEDTEHIDFSDLS
jgi:hypothetical protein